MTTLDGIKNIKDLYNMEEYEQVENYRDGEKAAVNYFKQIHTENYHNGTWSNEIVEFYGPKKFKKYDEKRNVTIETTIYEAYVNSTSEDYFYFYYNTEK